jgi:hypothetical protein
MFARGVLCFCPWPLLASRQNCPKSNDSPTYAPISRKSNDSPTYAKTGGWGVFPAPTFKYHLKCRRADIFDFSPYLLHFFPSGPIARADGPPPKAGPTERRGWLERPALHFGRGNRRNAGTRGCGLPLGIQTGAAVIQGCEVREPRIVT